MAFGNEDLVYGIIHDYPLREAVKAAKCERRLRPFPDILLVADPASNNDLRLSDALDRLQEKVFTISQTAAAGNPLAFVFTYLGDADLTVVA